MKTQFVFLAVVALTFASVESRRSLLIAPASSDSVSVRRLSRSARRTLLSAPYISETVTTVPRSLACPCANGGCPNRCSGGSCPNRCSGGSCPGRVRYRVSRCPNTGRLSFTRVARMNRRRRSLACPCANGGCPNRCSGGSCPNRCSGGSCPGRVRYRVSRCPTTGRLRFTRVARMNRRRRRSLACPCANGGCPNRCSGGNCSGRVRYRVSRCPNTGRLSFTRVARMNRRRRRSLACPCANGGCPNRCSGGSCPGRVRYRVSRCPNTGRLSFTRVARMNRRRRRSLACPCANGGCRRSSLDARLGETQTFTCPRNGKTYTYKLIKTPQGQYRWSIVRQLRQKRRSLICSQFQHLVGKVITQTCPMTGKQAHYRLVQAPDGSYTYQRIEDPSRALRQRRSSRRLKLQKIRSLLKELTSDLQ